MRHLTKHTFFQILWHIWQYTYGSVIIFWVFFPCIKYRSYIFLFESCWKRGFIYCIFKLDKWKSPKMSEFSLIILEKISDSWDDSVTVSPVIYILFLLAKMKKRIFGHFSYGKYPWVIPLSYNGFWNRITCVVCNWIIVSVFRNLRLFAILEKKVFKIWVVSCSVGTTSHHYQLRWFFQLTQFYLKKRLHCLPKGFIISYFFYI